MAGFRWQNLVYENGPAYIADRLVLLVLVDFMRDDGQAWPSVPTIASRTGMKERATFNRLRALRDAGWIVVVSPGGGRHRTTRYRVNLDMLRNGAETLHEKQCLNPARDDRNPASDDRNPARDAGDPLEPLEPSSSARPNADTFPIVVGVRRDDDGSRITSNGATSAPDRRPAAPDVAGSRTTGAPAPGSYEMKVAARITCQGIISSPNRPITNLIRERLDDGWTPDMLNRELTSVVASYGGLSQIDRPSGLVVRVLTNLDLPPQPERRTRPATDADYCGTCDHGWIEDDRGRAKRCPNGCLPYVAVDDDADVLDDVGLSAVAAIAADTMRDKVIG